ncbi:MULTISPECIES: ABC-three component system middle component 6 [Acinetobacter]
MIQNKENNLGINDYYDLVNSIEPISMNRFLLVLDWLYMLGKINSDSKKGLILCI